jgi:hypothetical protein
MPYEEQTLEIGFPDTNGGNFRWRLRTFIAPSTGSMDKHMAEVRKIDKEDRQVPFGGVWQVRQYRT